MIALPAQQDRVVLEDGTIATVLAVFPLAGFMVCQSDQLFTANLTEIAQVTPASHARS